MWHSLHFFSLDCSFSHFWCRTHSDFTRFSELWNYFEPNTDYGEDVSFKPSDLRNGKCWQSCKVKNQDSKSQHAFGYTQTSCIWMLCCDWLVIMPNRPLRIIWFYRHSDYFLVNLFLILEIYIFFPYKKAQKWIKNSSKQNTHKIRYPKIVFWILVTILPKMSDRTIEF